MSTIAGTRLTRGNKRDKKFPCSHETPQNIRSYSNCLFIKEVVSESFLGHKREPMAKGALLNPSSQILDDYCHAIDHILKASCLETYTPDLTMILTMLSEIMPHTSHASHH